MSVLKAIWQRFLDVLVIGSWCVEQLTVRPRPTPAQLREALARDDQFS
jgi:hypothetical protein